RRQVRVTLRFVCATLGAVRNCWSHPDDEPAYDRNIEMSLAGDEPTVHGYRHLHSAEDDDLASRGRVADDHAAKWHGDHADHPGRSALPQPRAAAVGLGAHAGGAAAQLAGDSFGHAVEPIRSALGDQLQRDTLAHRPPLAVE